MTQAKSQRSGARTPRGIRRALLEVTLRADKTQGRSTPGDPVRDAAQKLARSAPSSLDKFWRRAREHGGGPIDVIDMFSGCGGMSAGFLAANAVVPAYRLIAAVDIDRVANKTYEKNLGVRPYDDDVSDLARDDARIRTLFGPAPKRRRRPLVLIGCAPCQGFSSHRNSKGKRDQRNSLFSDFARIAAKLLPEAVVIENVPELLTTRYWSHVEEARNILEECGYHVHLGVHNMAEYGLPQERFRALMIAMRKPFVPVRGFLVRSRFRTVRSAIGNLPAVRAGEKHPKDDMH
ncbi:MAG: DNA cytosine methyltransferase, partial [Dehalococcoidia bacterium]